jgi:hypothetical protein
VGSLGGEARRGHDIVDAGGEGGGRWLGKGGRGQAECGPGMAGERREGGAMVKVVVDALLILLRSSREYKINIYVLYVSRFIIIYLNIDIKLKAKTNTNSKSI